MEDFQKFSKKALETPFWKISKSFMELFPCELGDPIVHNGLARVKLRSKV